MVREGWVSDPEYLAREAQLMADYDRGEMNIADYVALIQAPLIGIPQAQVDTLVARFVREKVLPRVYPQAWDVIRTLQARGEKNVGDLRLGNAAGAGDSRRAGD